MFNLRYHIASLVSIFLALSVGLLLGTIVNERGALDEQRDTLVSGLRAQYEELSSSNDELSAENERLSSFVSDTTGLLLAGQLQDRTVLVLTNLGRSDGLSAAREAVAAAGGTPIVITLNDAELGLSANTASEVATAFVDPESADPTEDLAAILASEWASPLENRPLTSALLEADVIDSDEFPATMRADGVIVIAAQDGNPDETALAIAAALSRLGVVAVGVEAQSLSTGVAAAALDRGLSAVDHVTSPEGSYSLVMVLAGRASGYFGEGAPATSRYPALAPSQP